MSIDQHGIQFSVAIPLYNKETSVVRAVESVLAQIHTNYELIIINDGSTDSSRDVVEQFKDSRIRIFDQKNAGEAAARNIGIQLSRFPYISMLDADDEWRSNHLSTIAELIARYPNAIFYGTSYDYFTVDSVMVEHARLIKQKNRVNQDRLDYLKSIAKGVYPIYSSSIVLNKSRLQSCAPFDTNLQIGTDISTWIKLSLVEQPVFSQVPTVVYYQDAENRSTSVPSYEAKKLLLLEAITDIYARAYEASILPKGLNDLRAYIIVYAYSLYCNSRDSGIRACCLSILGCYSRYHLIKARLRSFLRP